MRLPCSIIFAILLLGALTFFLIGNHFFNQRLKPMLNRRCSGKFWKQRFPSATNSQIRHFLTLIIDTFDFPENKQLSFTTEDKIMDIYFTIYPPGSPADSLELETFVHEMQDRYGIDVLSYWRQDITLGELFALTQSRPCS
jgi:hypothetical protein